MLIFLIFQVETGTIQAFRKSVAIWYYSLRNLAAVILLGILIYVGIRMAISTVASDEARYKKMFKDWVVSFILLFLMHYIMVITIEVNKILVKIIYDAMVGDVATNGSVSGWGDYILQITSDVFSPSFSLGMGALLIYIMIIGITLLYLITYIKRMLTVGFLIMISPLITITYSVDKIRDNRSQALDTWLKEFMFNILIQPFHCIIYVVFVQTALNLMHSNYSLSAGFLAVIMIIFMHKAEDIVKQIFNFQSASLGKAIANTALLTTGMRMLQNKGNADAKKGPNLDKIPDMSSSGKGTSTRMSSQNAQSKNAEQNMNAATQTSSSNQQSGTNNLDNSNYDTDSGNNNINDNNINDNNLDNENTQENGENKRTVKDKIADWGQRTFTPANIAKGVAKASLYTVLGGLALSTGQPQTLISAYEAGKAATDGIKGRQNRKQANKLVENNEKNFAGVYNDFMKKTGRSKESVNDFTNDIINGRVKNSEMDENERLYASYVRKMGKTYSATGENDISGRMEETLNMINNNEITPNSDQNYDMFSYEQQENSAATVEPKAEQEFENIGQEILNVPDGNNWEEKRENAKAQGQARNDTQNVNPKIEQPQNVESSKKNGRKRSGSKSNSTNTQNNKTKNNTGETSESKPSIILGNEGDLQEEFRNRNKS